MAFLLCVKCKKLFAHLGFPAYLFQLCEVILGIAQSQQQDSSVGDGSHILSRIFFLLCNCPTLVAEFYRRSTCCRLKFETRSCFPHRFYYLKTNILRGKDGIAPQTLLPGRALGVLWLEAPCGHLFQLCTQAFINGVTFQPSSAWEIGGLCKIVIIHVDHMKKSQGVNQKVLLDQRRAMLMGLGLVFCPRTIWGRGEGQTAKNGDKRCNSQVASSRKTCSFEKLVFGRDQWHRANIWILYTYRSCSPSFSFLLAGKTGPEENILEVHVLFEDHNFLTTAID